MMDMDEIRDVAWIPDDRLAGPARGVGLVFHGLGHTGDRTGPSTEELGYLAAGGLVVFPYYGPWAWMNRRARAFVDDLVESVYRCFALADDLPVVATGGSMGGLSSLLHARYAHRPVSACLANAPVTAMAYHFRERPALPKTIRHGYRDHPGGLDAALAEHSPLRFVDEMPDVPYLLIQGDQDKLVSKAHHADPFVAEMRRLGRDIQYVEVPGMGHCGPLPIEVVQREIDFVSAALSS